MEIHNLMEDFVKRAVLELLDETAGICKCEQCRMDMICYCLNKTSPMYVVSSRGIVHSRNKKRENIQMNIDILALGREAIDVISHTPRHGKDIQTNSQFDYKEQDAEPHFFLPVFIGRVMDENFQALTGASVKLTWSDSGELVKMISNEWENPVTLVTAMDGTFSFHAVPVLAERAKIQKNFQFCLEIQKDGFEPACKYFEIPAVSLQNERETAEISPDFFQIEDAILFQDEG